MDAQGCPEVLVLEVMQYLDGKGGDGVLSSGGCEGCKGGRRGSG